MQFDKREGGVSSLVYGGVEFITRAPKISFWRAMTDNDIGAGYPHEMAQWQIAGKCAKLLGNSVKETPDSVEITFSFAAPTVPAFNFNVIYTAFFDGTLGVRAEYHGVKGLPDMPVFAMDFKLKKQYENFTFYGVGPDENYIDRDNGARLGVFTSTAQDNFTRYLNPQECGNRTGVRYVNLYDENGAGYIGSHTALELARAGREVVVADSLVTGFRSAIPEGARFYHGDIRDFDFLDDLFHREKIDAVIHFAAYSLVGESVTNPLKYYDNNLCGTKVLLEAMVKNDIKKIVFSSTAATYGEPENIPILESDRTCPTNPYGETKLAMEKMFKWTAAAHGLRYVSLRYFNACGADESDIFNLGNDVGYSVKEVIETARKLTRTATAIKE